MTKQLVLGAFEEFTPNFIANAWHHERGDTSAFATLEFWQDLAPAWTRPGSTSSFWQRPSAIR